MMLAGERTRQYLAVSAFFMFMSLPISYLLQAPVAGNFLPGLGLGALGLAIKMVVLNVAAVNTLLYVLARGHGWSYRLGYQAYGLILALSAGFTAKWLALFAVSTLGFPGVPSLVVQIVSSLPLYALILSGTIYFAPSLAGLTQVEFAELRDKLRRIMGRG